MLGVVKITTFLLVAGSPSTRMPQIVIPDWAVRAFESGVSDPYVAFRYEVSDECALTDLEIVEAFPSDQWAEGDEAKLMEIATGFIGPFDSTGTHDWPLLKESTEIATFEPAHCESRIISLNPDDRAMTVECVFESGELLYVSARLRSEDGSLAESKRLERPLSSFGSSTFRITFSDDIGLNDL